MKNSTKSINPSAGATQVLDIEELENFDQKEFQDVLTQIDQIKFSARPHIVENILEFAKQN